MGEDYIKKIVKVQIAKKMEIATPKLAKLNIAVLYSHHISNFLRLKSSKVCISCRGCCFILLERHLKLFKHVKVLKGT